MCLVYHIIHNIAKQLFEDRQATPLRLVTTRCQLQHDGPYHTTKTKVEYRLQLKSQKMTSWNGNASILLALCEGNPLVTGGFPPQRTSNVDLWCFVDVSPTKSLSKQSGWGVGYYDDNRRCHNEGIIWDYMSNEMNILFYRQTSTVQPIGKFDNG